MTAAEVTDELGLDLSEILNIYPYGSQIYGTATEDSDRDFIIVYKSAFLFNGSFRNNAISNEDRTIQAVCYSRTGFIDAINNYEIGALECLFLPEDKVLQNKWPFKIQKFVEKEMVKKIISKASDSWHAAKMNGIAKEIPLAKKGIFHALRILEFGLQLKNDKEITDFSSSNELKKSINDDENFKVREYIKQRDELMKQLRK